MRALKTFILLLFLIVPIASSAQLPGSNLDKAKKIFEELLQKTPNDPDVYRYLGDIYQASNNRAKAREFYAKYEKMRPDDYYGHYRLGELARAADNTAESQRQFQQALAAMGPQDNDLTAKIAKARMLALTGSISESDKMYDELMAENPDDIDVADSRIETLIDTKRAEEAQTLAQEYIKKYPESISLKRNLVRAKSELKKYGEAQEIMRGLMAQRPYDAGLKTDYAYLYYDSGDWYGAKPLFDELSGIFPESSEIMATQDEIFKLSRPYIVGGFNLRWIGDERRYGPYTRFIYPYNSQWKFEADYDFHRNEASITGYNPNYSVFTNDVNLIARYKPHRSIELSGGLANQLLGSSYVPGAIAGVTLDDPVYGRGNIGFYYNKLFDDPTSALYFDGVEHIAAIDYEKTFYERVILSVLYSSTWYYVDGNKVTPGGGDDFARQDQGGGAVQFIVLKRPQIRLGYGFVYSKLHIVNDYTNVIPLIPKSEFSRIIVGFTHDWTKWITTDLGGFFGNDPARGIGFPDLYGFNITNRVKVSKRLELSGGYEYSSESILNNVGRYQYFFVEALYRF